MLKLNLTRVQSVWHVHLGYANYDRTRQMQFYDQDCTACLILLMSIQCCGGKEFHDGTEESPAHLQHQSVDEENDKLDLCFSSYFTCMDDMLPCSHADR